MKSESIFAMKSKPSWDWEDKDGTMNYTSTTYNCNRIINTHASVLWFSQFHDSPQEEEEVAVA